MPKKQPKKETKERAIDKLIEQHQRFVLEYLIDFNATQSYLRAGYSVDENTAGVSGHRLLRNDKIQSAIKEEISELSRNNEISAAFVLNGFKQLAIRCMQGEPVLDKDGIASGEWKFDSNVAHKSFESLAKYLSLFADKLDINLTTKEEYNFSGMTPEEKIQFLALITKAKVQDE